MAIRISFLRAAEDQIGTDIAMVWLAAIALNLGSTGRFLDVAVRDLEMALGAFTLARLAETSVPVRSEVKSVHPSAAYSARAGA